MQFIFNLDAKGSLIHITTRLTVTAISLAADQNNNLLK